jgi:hypothetical protein
VEGGAAVIVSCKQCGTPFEAFKRRSYCSNECRREWDRLAQRAARASGKQTLSNRRVEVNGATIIVQSGRMRVQSAQTMATRGITDNFAYLTSLNCECGANTAYNPYALPGFNFASRDWRRIDAEHKSGVCPKCAAQMGLLETELQTNADETFNP